MLNMKHAILPAALTLALALAGCGQSATTESTDTAADDAAVATDAAVDEDVESTEIVVPEDLAESAESIRSFDPLAAADDAPAIDTYDTAADAEELAPEQVDAVDEGTGDASKAPKGFTSLTNGGMEIVIPSDWDIAWEGAGKYSFLSADGLAYGISTAWHKESGHTYDVVSMVTALPKNLADDGYTGIEIIDSDTLYSSNGTLCDAYICVKASKGGKTFVRYYEFLESKNYVTGLGMVSTIDGWNANFDNINTIACSVTFAPGEGI